ncbi:MAG: hypothetical protein QOF60_1869 [Actinomycetota bacterium]|jgi:hypothetical protein|nr:hypothetical protein [Actinomycetota bacterium]
MPVTSRARRLGAVAAMVTVAAACIAGAEPAWASGPAAAVVIAVVPSPPADTLRPAADAGDEPQDRLLRELERLGFAVGLASTAQGEYQRDQAVLDLTQGTRQPAALYGSPTPTLAFDAGVVAGWPAIARRAHRASVTIVPGLLASSIPGGGAFVGIDGAPAAAAMAAGRDGTVEEVALGDPTSLVARTGEAAARHPLVVVELPGGDAGMDDIAGLLAAKRPGDLLVVVHLPPTPPDQAVGSKTPSRFFNQTPIGIAGQGRGRLDSTTTRQPGLVSLIDVAPTALHHLGLKVPAHMRGQVITTEGTTTANAPRLEDARRRWHDIRSGRQAGSLRTVVLGALLFFLAAGSVIGIKRAAPPALRLAGLGLLWWPAAALAAAPLAIRSGSMETLAIAAAALAAAALTDRLVGWPRGPLVPAVAGIAMITVDLATGGHLLTRSVLGPSVATGNRFYGISNEVEPILPILLLAGIAAAATKRRRLAYAVGGVFLAGVVGAGRLGADVGGVVTISAAFAVAGLATRSVRPRPALLLAIAAVPVAAVGLLIAADLVFGGGGHLANNLTRASGGRELWELVARRYELAFGVLVDPANAVALAIACLVVVFAYRNRRTLLPPELAPPGRAWTATLVGGLAGGVAGALSNDSGPILLVNAVVALAAVAAYLRGRPAGQVIDATNSPTSMPSPTARVTRFSKETLTWPRSMLLM